MTKKKKHREDQTLQTVCYCKLCSIDEFTGNFDENDARYMMHDDMVYEKVSPDEIRIDLDSIPKYMRDSLAAATLAAFQKAMQDPDIKAMIEEKVKRRKEGMSV